MVRNKSKIRVKQVAASVSLADWCLRRVSDGSFLFALAGDEAVGHVVL